MSELNDLFEQSATQVDDFGASVGGGEENVTVEQKSENDRKIKNKQLRAKRNEQMTQALNETIASMEGGREAFDKIAGSMSNSLEVEYALGWTNSGNLVVDQVEYQKLLDSAPKKPVLQKDGTTKIVVDKTGINRPIVQTGQIVGYIVKNVGDKPISYITEEYEKDEAGQFIGQRKEKVMAPGEEVQLARQYFTMLTARPEFSFMLSNGKVVRGSALLDTDDLKKELEAHYFSYDDPNKQINSDENKKNVGRDIGEGGKAHWVVKDEYLSTFGFLMNNKTGKSPVKKSTAGQPSSAMRAANLINKWVKEGKK